MTGTTEMLSSCSEQKYNSKMQDCCKKGRKDEIQILVPVNKFILKRALSAAVGGCILER